MPELLTPQQLADCLRAAPEWRQEGGQIARRFEFESFLQAIDFVAGVAAAAEALNHHPDIDIRYRRVLVAVSTHSAGGLTGLDFELAARIDDLAAA